MNNINLLTNLIDIFLVKYKMIFYIKTFNNNSNVTTLMQLQV